MRKLCIDEVGEVKMKKSEKKHVLQFEKKHGLQFEKKHIFFTALFWLLLWLCILKMICKA
jgi:hypothetical protein